MKVFIVICETLHHDSSYHYVEIFSTLEKATAFLGTELFDFLAAVDRGDFGKDFVEGNLNISGGKYEARIADKTSGFYESWTIEERVVD